jgi:hypothetical protein
VQLPGENVPEALLEKVTVPPGVEAAPELVSDTVAVQFVEAPPLTDDGEHTTAVLVARRTEKICEFDPPPPGDGLKTVMGKSPAADRSPTRMLAVSCPALTNVVVRLDPLKRTTDEPDTKLLPFTVSVNAASPTLFDVGEMLVVAGTGLPTTSWPLPLFEPLVSVPEPVTVKVVVPAGVAPVVETVNVVLLPPETDVGENEPVAPLGRPVIEKVLTVQLPPVFVVLTV